MTQRVGKYEIVRELGRGGMGVVYEAVDPGIGRRVALKVLPPSLTESEELRERFLREARAAGRLQHPNIVVIHDLGEDQGNLYIAMEYLEGKTLAERIARGRQRMEVREVLEVMAQVARGLHYAHQRGVVHRDIKPANILVTQEGVAKILDFGIARAGDQRMTKTGQVMGTIYYMSPEQINGQELDGRSDVFSAGVVLYELLTGAVPFDGESTGATMMKILTAPTPRLSERAPLSPAVLDEILARALAKQAEERFASSAEFAAALEAAKTESARTPAPPPTVPAARPEPLRATVVHQAAPAPASIEPQEFKGWEEKPTAFAASAAGRAPARAASSSMPAPPPVAVPQVPATGWRWWHLFWPTGESLTAAKVGCRFSAGMALLLSAVSLITWAVLTFDPSQSNNPDPRPRLFYGVLCVSMAFCGAFLLRCSRIAAFLPAAADVVFVIMFAVTAKWGADAGFGLFLLGCMLPWVPGIRGSLVYHRLKRRDGTAEPDPRNNVVRKVSHLQ